jgi:hypothetical protein
MKKYIIVALGEVAGVYRRQIIIEGYGFCQIRWKLDLMFGLLPQHRRLWVRTARAKRYSQNWETSPPGQIDVQGVLAADH